MSRRDAMGMVTYLLYSFALVLCLLLLHPRHRHWSRWLWAVDAGLVTAGLLITAKHA